MNPLITYKNIIRLLLCISIALSLSSCNSFLDEKPVASIPIEEAITTEGDLEAATIGAYDALQGYNSVSAGHEYYGDKYLVYGDMAADNLRNIGTFDTDRQVSNRNILPNNITVGNIWRFIYDGIGRCNTAIEAIPGIPKLESSVKNNYLGELRFLRAMMHFDLLRMYGDIPLILQSTKDGNSVERPTRAPATQVYAAVIADLEFAEANITQTDPYRATSLAATALLARVYLYKGDYAQAATKAQAVIAETGLNPTYESLFSNFGKNLGNEQIFVLDFNSNDSNPLAQANSPLSPITRYALRAGLLSAFEEGDLRFETAVSADGPFVAKYRDLQNGTDNVILIRAAEMYLIHAEASAYLGNFSEALTSLNAIRNRAGLDDVDITDRNELLEAIEHERRIELCFEGHRWFDLVRQKDFTDPTQTRAQVLLGIDAFRTLFPIPQSEIINNPNLSQNPGY